MSTLQKPVIVQFCKDGSRVGVLPHLNALQNLLASLNQELLHLFRLTQKFQRVHGHDRGYRAFTSIFRDPGIDFARTNVDTVAIQVAGTYIEPRGARFRVCVCCRLFIEIERPFRNMTASSNMGDVICLHRFGVVFRSDYNIPGPEHEPQLIEGGLVVFSPLIRE